MNSLKLRGSKPAKMSIQPACALRSKLIVSMEHIILTYVILITFESRGLAMVELATRSPLTKLLYRPNQIKTILIKRPLGYRP